LRGGDARAVRVRCFCHGNAVSGAGRNLRLHQKLRPNDTDTPARDPRRPHLGPSNNHPFKVKEGVTGPPEHKRRDLALGKPSGTYVPWGRDEAKRETRQDPSKEGQQEEPP